MLFSVGFLQLFLAPLGKSVTNSRKSCENSIPSSPAVHRKTSATTDCAEALTIDKTDQKILGDSSGQSPLPVPTLAAMAANLPGDAELDALALQVDERLNSPLAGPGGAD